MSQSPSLLKLQKMLERDEGKRFKPYRDTVGKTTIGIGRNLDDVGVSEVTVHQMFAEDAKKAEDACIAVFGEKLWDEWSENRKAGWINFAFNLGFAGVLGFRNTLNAAKANNWAEVERHLYASKWAGQVKSRADRVVAMVCREQWPYG